MLCPRCGNKIKKNNTCNICGYKLDYVNNNSKSKPILILRILLFSFAIYHGMHLILAGNIVMLILPLAMIIVIVPFFSEKSTCLQNINRNTKIIITFILVILIGMTGTEAKRQNSINSFIHEYGLKDEFSQIGIDDIKSIEISRKFDHPDYPSIDFELTNSKNEKYIGDIQGNADDTFRLSFFRKKDGEIEKEYYASNYELTNNLDFDLYDYKTDQLLVKGEMVEETLNPKIVIKIQTGENSEYAVNMPFENDLAVFYKIPSGRVYRVTRKAIKDSPDSTSFIWLDYDEKIVDGGYVEYENYRKYEFKNDESVCVIQIGDNTHLDLTGDYLYTFESIK